MWEVIANMTVIAYLVFLGVLVFVDLYASDKKIRKLEDTRQDLEIRLKEVNARYIAYVLGYELSDYQSEIDKRLDQLQEG